MKPYLSKLLKFGYLNHTNGIALEVGSGDGEDAKALEELGYTVEKFDKKEGIDLRDFAFVPEKYDFININNVLPFIKDKREVIESLKKMAASLKKGGVLHFTLFGINDAWATKPEMSFWTFDEANTMVDDLVGKCVIRSSEEYVGKTMAGDQKYWHMLRYVLVKK